MKPWWKGAVLYQIYPRSFMDLSGDGVGDLPGIVAKLDYIADLGVDGIWVSPFFTSPMRDFGYDVSDYCDVDPLFGTLKDFDALIEKAHALGIKVIIDQVYSHSSIDHPWFQESRESRTNPKSDWYVWADPRQDGTPPTNWQSVFSGPAWTWDARRRQYYLHNFLSSQPDLNVRHPEVQEALLETARFWFDRGVDGFRLDALNFYMHDPEFRDNPPIGHMNGNRSYDFQKRLYNRSHPDIFDFLKRVRNLADSYGDRFLLAEIGDQTGETEMIDYVGEGKVHSSYSFVFLEADKLTPQVVLEAERLWREDGRQAWPTWTFSNHDAPRAVSRWGEGDDPGFARMLSALLMALRGTVIVYQGEELALSQGEIPYHLLQDPEAIANWPLTKGRDGARTPMPWQSGAPYAGFSRAPTWLPVQENHVRAAVDVQLAEPLSMLQVTRRLIEVRKAHPALQDGGLEPLGASDLSVLMIRRTHDSGDVLCVFNMEDRPAETDVPEGTCTVGIVPDLSGGERQGTRLRLPPYGFWLGGIAR